MSQHAPPHSPAKRNSPILLVLLVLLGILLACLGYDQLIARAAVKRAQAELEGKIIAQNSAPGDSAIFTPAQVHEFIGFEPAGGMQDHMGYKYEEYHWTAGLPIRSYNLIVVYQGEKKPRLAAVVSNTPVEEAIGRLHAPDNSDLDVEVPPAALETGSEPKRPASGEKGSGEKKGSGDEKGSGEEKGKEAGKPDYKSDEGKGDAGKGDAVKPEGDKPDDTKPDDKPPAEKKPTGDEAPAGKSEEKPAPEKKPEGDEAPKAEGDAAK